MSKELLGSLELNRIYQFNCLDGLKLVPDGCINTCVTSPPYWNLRDYGVEGQIGIEKDPNEFIQSLVDVFREVRRVLSNDGTLWLNIGDSYAGSGRGPTGHNGIGNQTKRQGFDSKKPVVPDGLKPKDLVGIPWRLAFALQAEGWYLRSDIIWHKPNPMPESVKDRPTKAHEYIFLLTKSLKYYYDADSIKEPAKYAGDNRGARGDSRRGTKMNSMSGVTGEFKNKRTVWTVTTKPFKEAHFATFPPDLIEPCILAGCPESGVVLDPFMGAGTTALVSKNNNRNYIGFELNHEYIEIANKRLE